MEYRQPGHSGLKIPVVGFGTPVYPYWYKRQHTVLNPLPDFYGQ
jgi:predicted aldo/keto reductase-like oxidoreductase